MSSYIKETLSKTKITADDVETLLKNLQKYKEGFVDLSKEYGQRFYGSIPATQNLVVAKIGLMSNTAVEFFTALKGIDGTIARIESYYRALKDTGQPVEPYIRNVLEECIPLLETTEATETVYSGFVAKQTPKAFKD